MNSSVFRSIFLPGFILQSVLIGGGYATGRELVEFFLSSGPLGGFLGMLVATAFFSLISIATFELARMTKSYTYRTFFKQLLGKGWFIYELGYLALGILVLAVVGSAAGNIVQEHLGINQDVGNVLLMVLVTVLVIWGSKAIEKVLTGWSFLLYATYAVFVFMYLNANEGQATTNLVNGAVEPNWFINAIKYVGYNVAAVPLILFCVRHMSTRKEAILAGALAGPLAMIPAIIFYFAMIADPKILLDAPVPSDAMMSELDAPWLSAIFYVVLFGTFVETCTAFIHAMNERIAEVHQERGKTMSPMMRGGISLVAMVVSVYLATSYGLVSLIGGGYGTLTWMFIAIYLVPVLTFGVYKIWFSGVKEA